jgi:hypothetical protein
MKNKRFDKKKALGVFLFSLGFFVSIYSNIRFTGFAISQSFSSGFFFLGIALAMGGILLVNLSHQGQLEISLYKIPSKKGDEAIYMTDPENFFGKNGAVSLKQFKEDMEEIKKEPGLLKEVKGAYFPALMNRVHEGGIFSEMAKKYIAEMDFTFEKEKESRYSLPKTEISRIKNTFNDVKNGLSSAQRKLLKEYGLEYESRGKHGIVSSQGGEKKVTISISPSDIRAGKNTSSLILKLCEEQYRKRNKN